MPSGKIGVGARFRFQERRILDEDLIGAVALPDPQLVGSLLVPGGAGLGAIDFNREPVLPARAYLAHRESAANVLAESQQEGSVILRVDRNLLVILRL